uniref:Galactosylgalactosylxylosylprotein 3-beta-glucuronosyltransferase n=1 Tax=Steinernema glaseri TaxID=37863 RepID=A0A1I7ZNM8_9BILA
MVHFLAFPFSISFPRLLDMIFHQRLFTKAKRRCSLRIALIYLAIVVAFYFLFVYSSRESNKKRKSIFVITTLDGSADQVRKVDRLGKVLHRADNRDIVWIVSEKAHEQNDNVLDVLRRLRVSFIYLNTEVDDGGSANLWQLRQLAIDHILKLWLMGTVSEDSVVYFADVDMIYDARLFSKLREVTKVAVWPVGMLGKILVNSPIMKNGKITGFSVMRAHENPSKDTNSTATFFPGMAFSVKVIVEAGATFGQFCKVDKDIEGCLTGVKLSDFELLENDGDVFVWKPLIR